MDFQYSPKFSVKVTSDTSESSASLVITSSNRGANDQLYIMYIATDHDFMGVFMPGPLSINTIYKSYVSTESGTACSNPEFCV
jgi:hypothetical protein